MSMLSQPSIKRMSREQLAEHLLSPNASKVAVVDVRGTDHVGGHIKGSHHVPSTDLDYRIPQLVRTLEDKPLVIFHCALSQERGPRAARRYAEEKEKNARKAGTGSSASDEVEQTHRISDGKSKGQEIYVLDEGFVGWQEKYGTDKRLTDAYAPDIWADY